MQIRPVRAPSCSMRTDVGTDMTKLMAASRSFVNAPKSKDLLLPRLFPQVSVKQSRNMFKILCGIYVSLWSCKAVSRYSDRLWTVYLRLGSWLP
jgi:hypothetical protein